MQIERPTTSELEWIAGHVDDGRAMAAAVAADGARPDADALDAAWAAWLDGADPSEANDVVHAIGLAFGQLLVDDLGMRWVVVTDEHGTEVAAHEPAGDALVFPPNMVAKRWETGETGFLRPAYDGIAAQLVELRG